MLRLNKGIHSLSTALGAFPFAVVDTIYRGGNHQRSLFWSSNPRAVLDSMQRMLAYNCQEGIGHVEEERLYSF